MKIAETFEIFFTFKDVFSCENKFHHLFQLMYEPPRITVMVGNPKARSPMTKKFLLQVDFIMIACVCFLLCEA